MSVKGSCTTATAYNRNKVIQILLHEEVGTLSVTKYEDLYWLKICVCYTWKSN